MIGDTCCVAGAIVGQFYGLYAAEQLGMDRGAVNVVQSPAIALLPGIAGRLIDSFSYGSAFGLSAALTGLGTVILASGRTRPQ